MNNPVSAAAPRQGMPVSPAADGKTEDDSNQLILRRGYNCPGCGNPKRPEDNWCLRCLEAPPSLTC